MSRFTEILERALGRVFATLNRADEIGGEIRDFVTERVLADERYVALRKRVAARLGKDYTSRAEADAAASARRQQAAEQAPPPRVDDGKAEKPLGDPTLPAQIYGRSSCPWTGRAIRLLEDLKIDYDYVDLDDPDNEHFLARLVAATTQNTVPFVYVRGAFVGGFNALDEHNRVGKLEYLVMTRDERKKANPALASVVVTPRPNSDEVAPGESG